MTYDKESNPDLRIWIIPSMSLSWVHFPSYTFANNTKHGTFNDLSQDVVLAGILSRSTKMEVLAETPNHLLLRPLMQSLPGSGLCHPVCNRERSSGDWWWWWRQREGYRGGLRSMACVDKVFVGQLTPFGKSGRMSLKMSRSHTDSSVQMWDSVCPLGANRREGPVIKSVS